MNIFKNYIIKYYSATHHAVIDAVSGLATWIIAVSVKAIWGSPWGEPLHGWYSLVELCGYFITALGVLMYYEVFSCLSTIQNKEEYTMLPTKSK